VNPFWLSHEEKQPWLELSMGGGHGWSWSFKGGAMGELTGEGREGEGVGQGVLGGRVGYRREARWLLLCPCYWCALAVGGRRREEKREKRKEVKEKEREKGKIFQTWKFLKKIKYNL
jgi:hypothetical protein